MPIIQKNKKGQVAISNDVVSRIAGYAAINCYGVVGMAARNIQDGLVQLLKKERLTKGVKLSFNEGRISVSLYIIVEYGTNIAAISETLLSNVRYSVEELVGVKVDKVRVFVEGVRVS